MIILDTNILWGVTLDSSTADLLRALRAAGVRVAVPWVVMEELASQRALQYAETHDKAASALKELKRHVPWGGVPKLGQVDTERHRKHWRNTYRQMVEVIQPSAEVLRNALFRESNVLAPCKRVGGQKGEKTGSRDAAIWLTAVEYARKHEDDKVYFVSTNTKDFGNGTEYPEPMKSDLAGIEGRFFHLTSMDDVLSRFAKQADPDPEFLPALLAREETIELLVDALSEHLPTFASKTDDGWLNPRLTCTRLGDGEDAGEALSGLGWFNTPSLTLDDVSDESARSIDGQDWYMATVRLFATGFMVLAGPSFIPAANALEARVLVTQDKTGTRPSVLRCKPPRALDAEEVSRVLNTWTNWQQEVEASFPPDRLPRQASAKTSALPQSDSSAAALSFLIMMAVDAWMNRKRSK
ncbi:PIN domain-containing protein [Micromonospora sp. NBRC 110038]|uniref:PIN domain-containing protein n=1 Tax=Micromonospora sp. NBRC 110038 TaxID=1550034 RepID=UPI001E577926|nr:PIN domain-containing protein [Micromonospora sp. NBRC 110038]